MKKKIGNKVIISLLLCLSLFALIPQVFATDVKVAECVRVGSQGADGLTFVSDGAGQCFKFIGNPYILKTAKFKMKRTGTPTGTLRAKLYLVTGTCGSNGKPSGVALAFSGTYNIASVSNRRYSLISFTFTSGYIMQPDTFYFITVECISGTSDGSKYVATSIDYTANPCSGNMAYKSNPITQAWIASANIDVEFEVWGEEIPSGQTENFYGDINPRFTINHANTWMFKRYSQINPMFTITNIFSASTILNLFASVTETFTISLKNIFSFNLQATINPLFTINKLNDWMFNLYSRINPTFTITNLFSTSTILNLFGEVAQLFTTTIEKTFSFNVYSTINPLATINKLNGWIFNLYQTVNPTFNIESASSLISGTVLNLYGIINLMFNVVSWNSLSEQGHIVSYVLIVIFASIILLPLLFVIEKKRRGET